LDELSREAADCGQQQGVNEAAFMEQKLFDEPKREKK
jgi:hypothetical protein